MHSIIKFDSVSPRRSMADYIFLDLEESFLKGFVNVAATLEQQQSSEGKFSSKCMNDRKFYILNTKTRPLEMVLIILQQQIYRSAKWIVNAANTIRLIMHYYIYVRPKPLMTLWYALCRIRSYAL